jgi:hypothetical protein
MTRNFVCRLTLRFANLWLATLLIGACLPAAHAQETQGGSCSAAAITTRDALIAAGASITYGNSLEEIAVYRRVTGIDADFLAGDFQTLPWFSGDYTDPEDGPPAAEQFRTLLMPAGELKLDTPAYERFHAAQDFLMQSGLRSYRPERGQGENAADWWLHDESDPVYRTDDFADWLQSMAASDTFHRSYRSYGKAYYRPLISSWTYFDPSFWDVDRYDRVTAHALSKWRDEGKFVWSAVAYSRVRHDQPEADALIAWFQDLDLRARNCTATTEDLILYPLFRFHTLRLLFTRAIALRQEDSRAAKANFDQAMGLLADRIGESDSGGIGDRTVATRAALLMAAYGGKGEAFYPDTDLLVSSPQPYVQSFRDLRWAAASSFRTYVELAQGQEPLEEEVEVLNGLSTQALYRLLEQGAFTPDFRLKLAESGWVRSYLLGQQEISDLFLQYLAANRHALEADVKTVLAAKGAERQRQQLLFLLRHSDFSMMIDNVYERALWCSDLGDESYRDTVADLMGPVLRMAEIPAFDRWRAINYHHEYGYYTKTLAAPVFEAAGPSEEWPDWLEDHVGGSAPGNFPVVDVSELIRLRKIPAARDFLTRQAMAWANEERSIWESVLAFLHLNGDQEVAEALHLAITKTRQSCSEGDVPGSSRAAWIVLHDNPRWKEWAERTPYWYE